MAQISGSDLLVKSLLHCGVEVIFGYPGGAIMPVYDSLFVYREKIRHVLVRHEQGATHAAEGYARAKRQTGVCLVTSGPGATNTITGLADAMMDSVPMVCISGQVNSKFLGTDAFQETDVIGIAVPVTKWCFQATKPEEIPGAIIKAFAIAQSGRPGPVLIDITKDAQFAMVEEGAVEHHFHSPLFTPTAALPKSSSIQWAQKGENLQQAADLINNAERPYIFAGNGVGISKATDAVIELAEQCGAAIAGTLHGLSTIPQDHPQWVGMLGMHGNYGPNVLTNKADVIIAVGMRFDDRVTGDLSKYAKQAKIIHIEIDPSEINKAVPVDIGLVGDAKLILEKLNPLVQKNSHPEWLKEFQVQNKKEFEAVIDAEIHKKHGDLMTMGEAVRAIAEYSESDAIVVADVGQHQMSVARYFGFKKDQDWISSGGLGTMGFALPASIGTAIAEPQRQSIAIIGDGGFQMTLQELGTIAQEKLPIKIIILNNNFLGMVRQWQQLFFDGRYSFVEMSSPNFVKVADAYDIPGFKLDHRSNAGEVLKSFFETSGPALLEIVVEKEQNIFPMIPAGAGVDEMLLGNEGK